MQWLNKLIIHNYLSIIYYLLFFIITIYYYFPFIIIFVYYCLFIIICLLLFLIIYLLLVIITNFYYCLQVAMTLGSFAGELANFCLKFVFFPYDIFWYDLYSPSLWKICFLLSHKRTHSYYLYLHKLCFIFRISLKPLSWKASSLFLFPSVKIADSIALYLKHNVLYLKTQCFVKKNIMFYLKQMF